MEIIGGSNAVGETFPPHFQSSTKATEKREKIRIKIVTYFVNIKKNMIGIGIK